MGILIHQLRIHGFRGIKNIEINFEPTTVLVGVNNSGKTTILRALQLALGGIQNVSADDFYYSEDEICDKIVIDTLIIPVNSTNTQINEFDDEWNTVFTANRTTITNDGRNIVSFRTVFEEDHVRKTFKKRQFIIDEWPAFIDGTSNWHDVQFVTEGNFVFEELPFHYLDANRDILEDIRSKTSYLGKLLSSIDYEAGDIEAIESMIAELNRVTVSSSTVLSDLESTLSELDSAMNNSANTVSLTPFTKKVKDLNRGVNISYSEFSMDYHGMGTRSWSSLLVLKSFLKLYTTKFEQSARCFFPILAIEEPESHLHPSAQKKLYSQIATIPGQKIVSTHSSYVAGCAKLGSIRSITKRGADIVLGKLPSEIMTAENIRKITRQVINTRGELFFSRCVILFEGETEEQALPLLAERYFSKNHLELGIDFIGVGGHGNYAPFISFCENLNIDYFILSDNEAAINQSVVKQINESTLKDQNRVVFLNANCDFERELIDHGYIEEVRAAYLDIELAKCTNEQHRTAKTLQIAQIPDIDYYDLVTAMKTQFAPVVARKLAESPKGLPNNVINLFAKIQL